MKRFFVKSICLILSVGVLFYGLILAMICLPKPAAYAEHYQRGFVYQYRALERAEGRKIVTLGGMLIGVAGGVLAGVGGNNPYLVAVGVGLKCFGSAPACYMILAMIADVLDHVEAKSGNRCDGLTMSIYSAIMIAATPVCVGIYNGILGATGFSSEALVQSDAVKNVISVSYGIFQFAHIAGTFEHSENTAFFV